MPQKLIDVYVGYNEIDRGLASLILATLTAAGMKVCGTSIAQNPESSEWQTEMRRAILRTEFVVVLVTRNSLNSGHAAFEVGMAIGASRPIFILFDGISIYDLPDFMHQHQVFGVSELTTVINEMKSLHHGSGTLAIAH